MDRRNINTKQQKPMQHRKTNDNEKDILQIFRFSEETNIYKILSVGLSNEKIYIKIQHGKKGDDTSKNSVRIILEEKEAMQLSKTLESICDFLNKNRINKVLNNNNSNNKD